MRSPSPRRVRDRRRRPSDWPWWLLASIWVHAGAGLGLLLTGPPGVGAGVEPLVEITRIDPALPVSEPGPPAPGVQVPADPDDSRRVSARDALPGVTPPPEADPPPDAPPRDRWVPYLRTAADADVAPPDDPLAISARDVDAPAPTQAPITASTPGKATPQTAGVGDAPGSPTPDLRPVPDNDPRAGIPTGDARTGRDGGGGGQDGVADGAGAPGTGGDRREGGETAPGGSGRAGAAPPEARDGAGVPGDVPDWWHPIASRVFPRPPDIGDASGGSPSPTAGPARAIVESPGRELDRGGTEGSGVDSTAPGQVAGEPGVLLREEHGTEDPVDALRDALGWGPIDRSKLGPRAAWAATIGTNGMLATSPQISADLPTSWTPQVDVKGTALGRYVEELEGIVAERWATLDLTVGERAAGIGGGVIVRYKVWPGGKVTDRQIAASSGMLFLDHMALQAIPDHVPRFPRDLDREEPLWHQVQLQYRNPLVSGGGGP